MLGFFCYCWYINKGIWHEVHFINLYIHCQPLFSFLRFMVSNAMIYVSHFFLIPPLLWEAESSVNHIDSHNIPEWGQSAEITEWASWLRKDLNPGLWGLALANGWRHLSTLSRIWLYLLNRYSWKVYVYKQLFCRWPTVQECQRKPVLILATILAGAIQNDLGNPANKTLITLLLLCDTIKSELYKTQPLLLFRPAKTKEYGMHNTSF